MAATAVSTVLSKFGELAVSEGRLLVQVGDKMMLMRDRLEWLQAFIRDADRKRWTGTDGLSRVWLRQTRDVAFQVEDALDEFFRKVDLESQGYQSWKKWSKYLAGCWTQITVRHVLSDRLDKINSRLEQISENQKEYNIEHTPLVALTSSMAASAAWYMTLLNLLQSLLPIPEIITFRMAGRAGRHGGLRFDDDVKTLEKMLLRRDHLETMFISIIGESGVGKSTLALYKRWPGISLLVFMEPDSWPEEVVQTLYNAYSKEIEDTTCAGPAEDAGPVAPVGVEKDAGSVAPIALAKGTTDQAGKLREFFSGRKYNLVLGGITSIPMFNLLSKCLPNNNNGSSVVLVLDAENEEVALHANKRNQGGINGTHLVTRLDEKRSAELFRSKALRKEEVSEDPRKYEERVFGITGGHRLSIVLLAGLLRFKEKPLQWEAVLQQLMPAAMMQEVGEGEQLSLRANLSTTTAMERIFWACFEDLPNDIKSCFLYLVTAGKNCVVQADGIVGMWIGEGFIKPHKGKTMEEVGRGYMKELALRCLVQVQSRDDVGMRSTVGISVHGSLHGFLLSEAREAGFVEIHDIHDAFVPPSARRLSFQIYGGRYSRLTNKLPKLRSFVSLGNSDLDASKTRVDSTGAEKELYDLKFLLASKFLRVLVLGGQRVNQLPEEIGNLLELRYIGINSPELKELPTSVKRLLNLQTLSINGTGVEKIDPAFWKIKTLRHVVASSLTLPESLEEELPELQTLAGVKAPQGQIWDAHNCPLRRMRNLRELELEGIQAEHHRVALESALQEMHLLVSVTLRGDGLPSCVFTAENLRFLELIQLQGRVDWPTGPLNHHMLRPNLRNINLEPIEDVPPRILAELNQ